MSGRSWVQTLLGIKKALFLLILALSGVERAKVREGGVAKGLKNLS